MRPLRAPLAALALLAASGARAADLNLDGGFCLPPRADGAWTEVWAEIENKGAAEIRGTLEAEIPGYHERGPHASRDVAVAPGTKKRFTLLL